MWQTIISILCIINAFNSFSDAVPLSTYNESSLILPLYSQLSDLRSEQEQQATMIDRFFSTMDIQTLRAQLEQQGDVMREVIVDCKEKLTLTKRDIQFLRTGLVNVTDIIKSNITLLKVELEQQNKKHETNYKSDIQSLKQGMEQQGQLINEQRLLIDKQERLIGQLVKEHKLMFTSLSCSQAGLSGIKVIVVSKFSSEPFPVVCDAETRGGGWTVILKRIDGSVDFYRNWTEYQRGFGDLDGEFFIGLDKLHALTTERNQELLIVLEDFEGNATFAKYDAFAISDEEDKYRMNTLGSYSGTAGDSFDNHRGQKFSTFDNDNDGYEGNCAERSTGAWWYSSYCHYSNLAGKYKDNSYGKGVNWYHFRGHKYSLKKAIMIRPRK